MTHPQTTRPVTHTVRLVFGILLIVFGTLTAGVGILILLLPYGLFILGGGGDVEAFDEFSTGFVTPALIVGAAGVLMTISGITLLVASATGKRAS